MGKSDPENFAQYSVVYAEILGKSVPIHKYVYHRRDRQSREKRR
jgi:hypothetical protein